LNSIA
jgi:polyadenylate-binding protein